MQSLVPTLLRVMPFYGRSPALGNCMLLSFVSLRGQNGGQWAKRTDQGSELTGQVTGDGRQVSDSGLASASRRELVNEKG